jgi:hypothetical protein
MGDTETQEIGSSNDEHTADEADENEAGRESRASVRRSQQHLHALICAVLRRSAAKAFSDHRKSA